MTQLSAADQLQDALRLYELRHYRSAREVFLDLVRAGRGTVETDFYLGRLALWFDDGATAREHLERAARMAPTEARIQNALGDAFGLTAQNAPWWEKLTWAKRARQAYEKAVDLAPDTAAWRWSLMAFYCIAPRVAGGGMEKAFEQAAEIRRLNRADGRVAFATLYLANKRAPDAFAEFDRVLAEAPDDFLALYHVGRCAAVSGQQLTRGRDALERCLRLTPPVGDGMPTVASTHQRLGEIAQQLGDRSAAQTHFAAAQDADPDFRPSKVALKN